MQYVKLFARNVFCIFMCAVLAASFASCSKKSDEPEKSELISGLTDKVDEENVKATVSAIEKGLQNFDTDVFDSCVNSSTLGYIISYSKQHKQFSDLGKAIFKDLSMQIKDIDLDGKTVTVTVRNKDMYITAANFAGDLKNQYSTTQLISLLGDENFLDSSLSTLTQGISNCQMGDAQDVTLTFEQSGDYLKFTFDETAESAVSGGALEAVKTVWD